MRVMRAQRGGATLQRWGAAWLCAWALSLSLSAQTADTQAELMPPDLEVQDPALLPKLPSTAAVPKKEKPAPRGFTRVLPPGVPELSAPSDGEAAPQFDDLPEIISPPAPSAPPAAPSSSLPHEGPAVTENPSLTEPPAPLDPATAATPPTPYAAWIKSPRTARDEAKKNGLCWLLAATSTQVGDAGQRSQQMNEDIFLKEDFNQFATENLILCSLDYTSASGGLPLTPEEVRREGAMQQVRDFLKIRGMPTVIVFSPEGHELMRWRGYVKGREASYLQQLKNVVTAENERLHGAKKRRQGLAQKGYRPWTSRYGSQVFARLVEFDARRVQLEDDEGRRFRVDLSQLILTDREIITRRRLGLPSKLVPEDAYDVSESSPTQQGR
jgi:hypothetical protein